MKMNRMSRTSSALMEAMEFTRDFTKFPIELQYLVTLKALSSLMHLRTDRPTGGMISWLTRMNSMIEEMTTTKSNLDRKAQVIHTADTQSHVFGLSIDLEVHQ